MSNASPRIETGEETGEPHLLVVDDDARLRELLRRYLVDQGFRVTLAAEAREARAQLQIMDFDLILLDVMMPGETGLALTASLREKTRVPILLLTAMAEPHDRINGLEHGADDYLVKPFEPRELVLRIRNILNRVETPPPPRAAEISLGACRLDVARGELRRGSEMIHLTTSEMALLMALARRQGEAVTRETLASEAAIGGSFRTVDVQMTRLRRKLEPGVKFPRYLQSVRGVGYVLKPD